MSSVGNSDSADRSGDKNMLRRTREEFRQRESDLVKRHNVENRRLNERHEDEIERIKGQHSEQMQNAKEHSSETFSARDQKYQKDIEDIRNIHRKQLQTVADEGQRRDENLRKTISTDVHQRDKYNEERFEGLNDDFNAESRRLADTYAARGREQKDAQSTAIDRLRDGLNKRHDRELESLRETLGSKVAETQKNFGDYRKDIDQQRREQRVKDLKVAHAAGANLMDAVRTEREARQQNEGQLREDYRDSIEGERQRFNEALTAQADRNKETQLSFREDHDGKDADRIGSLQRENRGLREKAVREEQKLRHRAGEELAHAKHGFQNNVDAYRRERDEAYRQANDGEGQDFDKEREKYETRLVETVRDSRDKISSQGRQQRIAYEQMKGDFEARSSQKDIMADSRVGNILEKTNEEKSRLIERERINHTANQRQKQDEIKALRETFEDDKQGAVESMRELMRKQELRHQERLGVVVGKYDKQVLSLKDDILRERKLNGENTKRLTEELGRAHQRELDQADAKSRAKLAELNDRHSQEVHDVTRRYEEKLDQVLGEIKKT